MEILVEPGIIVLTRAHFFIYKICDCWFSDVKRSLQVIMSVRPSDMKASSLSASGKWLFMNQGIIYKAWTLSWSIIDDKAWKFVMVRNIEMQLMRQVWRTYGSKERWDGETIYSSNGFISLFPISQDNGSVAQLHTSSSQRCLQSKEGGLHKALRNRLKLDLGGRPSQAPDPSSSSLHCCP